MPFPFYSENQRAQIKYYSKNDPRVIEGKLVQNTIGIIALVWPIVLIVGNWAMKGAFVFEPSISDYFHTGMGHIFTGGLFVIGASMLTYKGFHCVDGRTGNIAGLLAILVALFPVNGNHGTNDLVNTIHYVSALLLFLVLAYFCIVIFTLSPDDKINKKYKMCGWAILLFICGMGLDRYAVFGSDSYSIFGIIDLFLVLEILTVWVFGYSWLLKGNPLDMLRSRDTTGDTTPILKEKERLYNMYDDKYPQGPTIEMPSALIEVKEVEVDKCYLPK